VPDARGGVHPSEDRALLTNSSVHYEVVTDRWNGNSATITYDVIERTGGKVGEVELHLSVPGSRWDNVTRGCDARGAVTCKVSDQIFSVFSGNWDPHGPSDGDGGT
jgi:hypothetical protein